MRKISLCLLSYMLALVVPAQNDLPAFGKPIRQELEMKEYAPDKDAHAVKLLDYQEKEIIADYELKVKTERWVKIKILDKQGFDQANITIPFSRTKGTKIADITAYIHYMDPAGNIITEKVEKKDLFKDKDDDGKRIRFTFPNVKAGCIVEYRYEKTEKNYFHLGPWVFQDLIPTVYSKFILIMPSRININHKLIGSDTVEARLQVEKLAAYDISHRTYVLRNIPAFKPEPMMSSMADNLIRIEFAVRGPERDVSPGKSKWERLAFDLNGDSFFGKQFHKIIPGTEALIDSAKLLPTKEKRIDLIFQRVKKKVKWDEQQTFYAGDIAEAWKEGKGNSAEINLLILNLLRRCGIRCSPLLVSTRENGRLDQDFFTLNQFNGVDVLVPDSPKNYILDGTQKYQSFSTPPVNVLNRYVLNVDTASVGWLFVSDPRPLLKTTLLILADLCEKGELTGTAAITSYDYSKVRRLMEKNKTSGEKQDKENEEKEFLQKDFTELTIDSIVFEDEEEELFPLTERFNFSYQLSSTDNFLFLDPFFLSNFRKNPFLDSARHTSLDFTSRQYLSTTINISLPLSYEVDHLPKNIRMRMADSTILFERSIRQQKEMLYFSHSMEVLNPLFDREEYPPIRDFFARMYGMVTEQIILKRK